MFTNLRSSVGPCLLNGLRKAQPRPTRSSPFAKCMWRKRRIQKFIKAKMDARSVDFNHPAFDPELAAEGLRLILDSDPQFLERLIAENPQAKEFLATDKPKHLRDLVSAAEISKKLIAGLEARRQLPPQPEPPPEIK